MAERRKLTTFDQWLRELTGRRPAPPAGNGERQPEDTPPPAQPQGMDAFIRAAGRRRRLR